METHSNEKRPIVFGEVLFDCFVSDGHCVLGGAPFNVAWHLQGFGLAPLLISAVGADALGRTVLDAMADWGMDCSGVQIDPAHPTGEVRVTLTGQGHATYDILADQAYDYIRPRPADTALDPGGWSLLYHGTLATRSRVSRDTLLALRERLALPSFIDLNLRAPWWSRPFIDQIIADARWVKLNDEELEELLERFPEKTTVEDVAALFLNRHRIQNLIVTLGSRGAALVTPVSRLRRQPQPLASIADTVGAGDAFSAVVILGQMRRWSAEKTLERAMTFAAAICGIRGATTRDAALYADFLAAWEED